MSNRSSDAVFPMSGSNIWNRRATGPASSQIQPGRRWVDDDIPAVSQSKSDFGSNDVRKHQIKRGLHPRDEQLEFELFGDPDAVKTGINFDKYDDIPVEITGNDVPESISNFEDINLPELLAANLGRSHYSRPTPVQKYALPVCMGGRDLMACAQTGSGKTAAFLLPSLHRVLSHNFKRSSKPRQFPTGAGAQRCRSKATPSVLVLAPTRELTMQIFQEARKFCYRTGLKPVVVYGGQEVRLQLHELDRGCDILVATPGRLVDFVRRRRISLASVRVLIFDEADRMLDMGFEPQIRRIVEEEDMPSRGRQTLMFSATFPKEIQQLAQDFLKDYIFLAVGRVGSTTDSITQRVEYADERDKCRTLLHILPNCEGLTLIFVETKRAADTLEDWLMREGVNATSIHGDRTQQEREYALQQFREGRCPVLVATDVASRGLDIPNVLHVINYDMPSQIDDYVHRIGRTGRCGNTGTAISFVNERCQAVIHPLYELLKENDQPVPAFLEQMVVQGGFGTRRRGGRGGPRFGARDARHGQYGDRPQRQERLQSGPNAQYNQQEKQPRGSGKSRKGRQEEVVDDWSDSFRGASNLGGNYNTDAW